VGKHVPLSMILLTMILPIALSRLPRPKRQLKTIHKVMAVYIVLWAWMCVHVYTRYVWVQ
jgi:hypothetical protein